MSQSGWLLPAFFVMGCALRVSEFTAPDDASPQADAAADGATVEDGADSALGADADTLAPDAAKSDTGTICMGAGKWCPSAMACVDFKTDPNNCGTCDHVCVAPTPTCKTGLCKP